MVEAAAESANPNLEGCDDDVQAESGSFHLKVSLNVRKSLRDNVLACLEDLDLTIPRTPPQSALSMPQ